MSPQNYIVLSPGFLYCMTSGIKILRWRNLIGQRDFICLRSFLVVFYHPANELFNVSLHQWRKTRLSRGQVQDWSLCYVLSHKDRAVRPWLLSQPFKVLLTSIKPIGIVRLLWGSNPRPPGEKPCYNQGMACRLSYRASRPSYVMLVPKIIFEGLPMFHSGF